MENLITSLEQSIEQENWYAALLTALTLPDIAGRIHYPRQGSQKRYINWFDKYVKPKYPVPDCFFFDVQGFNCVQEIDNAKKDFLTGEECYAIRCKFLHEGKYSVKDADVLKERRQSNANRRIVDKTADKFLFIVDKANPQSHRIIKWEKNAKILQIHVDVFCQDVISGVNQWLADIKKHPKKQEALNKFLTIQMN